MTEDSVVFENIKEIKDFSRRHNEQLREFFVNYAKAEDKKLTGLTFINAGNARKGLRKLVQ